MKTLFFKQVGICATQRCTLKCKDCCEMIPHISNPSHPSIEYFRRVLDRLFNTIDGCGRLDIAGGEPLLHSELGSILRYAFNFSNKSTNGFRILTNGTIIPNEEIVDICKHNSDIIDFLIGDYGVEISTHVKQLIDLFETHSIRYVHRNYSENNPYMGGWVKFNLIDGKRNSIEKAERLYAECIRVRAIPYGNMIHEGKLYACNESMLINLMGFEPPDNSEYVDLLDETLSREQLREQLKKLYDRKMLKACLYCGGWSENSERIIPAKQYTEEELRFIKKY